MAIRGARALVFGATLPIGRRLVEGYLALGAEVVAADDLRTRLEELRAEMGQHERLWVAESGVAGGADVLWADVSRDQPIDLALLVVDASRDDAAARVDAFLEHARQRVPAAGRVLVIASGAPASPDDFAGRVQRARCLAPLAGLALSPDGARGTTLERLVAISDPGGARPVGWLDAATLVPA